MEPIVEFIFLLTGLFIIPKFFIRYNIPEQVSEIFFGIILGPLLIGLFTKDAITEIMGTIGIIALFFIAGYDVNIENLKKKRKTLQENGIIHLILIVILTIITLLLSSYTASISLLIAIAFLTPSAGFILSSLKSLKIQEDIKAWVESKVISAEIFTLFLLLIIMNFKNPALLFGIVLGLVFLFIFLPHFIEFFFRYVIPKSTNSDTFFLFLLAIIVAFFTHMIGVHYIIGAFFVGIIVNKISNTKKMLDLNINTEKIKETFASFSSIFVPFYFFAVGLGIEREMISLKSIFAAFILFVFLFSLKIMIGFVHRRLTLTESFRNSVLVSLLTTPTLLFTFVVAELIHANISEFMYGILIMYGLLSASIPYVVSLLLRYSHKKI